MNETNKEEKDTPGLPLQIYAQYVRDISFENPMAPEALRRNLPPPKTKVDFGIDARKLEGKELGEMYEVILSVRAEAHRDGQTVFIAEVQYGIAALLGEMPEEQKQALLLIEIPRLAFPFVRQIMYTISVQGGYPPLLLHPVNFHALYMNSKGANKAPAAAESKKDDKKDRKKKGKS